jgi:hypothetical protein
MKKQILERCHRLHIRDVSAAIPYNATALILDIGKEQLNITGRLTNLKNGYRYFFLCPQCHKPFESLYRRDYSVLLCRYCLGLIYATSAKLR